MFYIIGDNEGLMPWQVVARWKYSQILSPLILGFLQDFLKSSSHCAEGHSILKKSQEQAALSHGSVSLLSVCCLFPTAPFASFPVCLPPFFDASSVR